MSHFQNGTIVTDAQLRAAHFAECARFISVDCNYRVFTSWDDGVTEAVIIESHPSTHPNHTVLKTVDVRTDKNELQQTLDNISAAVELIQKQYVEDITADIEDRPSQNTIAN